MITPLSGIQAGTASKAITVNPCDQGLRLCSKASPTTERLQYRGEYYPKSSLVPGDGRGRRPGVFLFPDLPQNFPIVELTSDL